MKKVLTVIVLVSIVGVEILLPVHKARAGLFDDAATWGVWAKEYILDPFSKVLANQLLRRLSNDIINTIQGGGKPRFVQQPGRFLKEAIDAAAGQTIVDITGAGWCQPFRAQLDILLGRTYFPQQTFDERVACTATEIFDDFKRFKDDFRNGGWATWIQLHETRNTLLGASLIADDEAVRVLTAQKQAVEEEIRLGQGYLGQKTCSAVVLDYGPGGTETVEVVSIIGKSEVLTDSKEWNALVSRLKGRTKPVPGLPAGYAVQDIRCLPGAERIVTPGNLIGDQVSRAIGSDIAGLIAADELGEVVGAIIDALINRGVREGLALMTTGRGSQSRPSQGTYSPQGQAPTQQVGLEGTAATEILNNLLEARNNAEQVIALKRKLIARESQFDRFNQHLTTNFPEILDRALEQGKALEEIKGGFSGTILGGALTGKALETRRGCEGARLDDTGGIVDHCLFAGLNTETANPGPYHANLIFSNTLAADWQKLVELLGNLINRAGAIEQRVAGNAQCQAAATNTGIPELIVTLSPPEDDPNVPKALPFTSGEGTTLNWNTEKGYLYELLGKESGKEVGTSTVADLRLNLEFSVLPLVEAQRDLNQNNPYITLIESVKEQIKILETDIESLNAFIQDTGIYASILGDYDRAGRTTELSKAISRYNAALSGSDDALLETEYLNLLEVQGRTRELWLEEQITIESGSRGESDFARERAREKIPIIREAIALIEASLPDISENFDPTQLGLSPSQAVAQALEIDAVAIDADAQLRNARIQQERQKTTNALGEFPARDLDRYRLSLNRDPSAWGKYFQFRFEKTYAGIIDAFYRNYVSSQLSSIASQCGL